MSYFNIGESVSLTASELSQYFRISLESPEFTQDDLLVRISFLHALNSEGELLPLGKGKKNDLYSTRTGRMSVGVLLDQGVISEEHLPALITYAKVWEQWAESGEDPYKVHSTDRMYLLVDGPSAQVTAEVIEFSAQVEDSTRSCPGLVNISFSGAFKLIVRGISGLGLGGVKASESSRSKIAAALAANSAQPTRRVPTTNLF